MKKLTTNDADVLVSLLRRGVANNQIWLHKERKATATMTEVKCGDWKIGEETFSANGSAGTDVIECERRTSQEDGSRTRTVEVAIAIASDVIKDMYNEKE